MKIFEIHFIQTMHNSYHKYFLNWKTFHKIKSFVENFKYLENNCRHFWTYVTVCNVSLKNRQKILNFKNTSLTSHRQTLSVKLFTWKTIVNFFELGAILVIPTVTITSNPFGGTLILTSTFWIFYWWCYNRIVTFANGTYPGFHVFQVVKSRGCWSNISYVVSTFFIFLLFLTSRFALRSILRCLN